MTDTSPTDFSERVLTVDEAAAHLRIGRGLLYKEIAAHTLRPLKIGRRTLFTGRELERYLEAAAPAGH